MTQDKKIRKIISSITGRIKEKYHPEKIILFGSFAYGKPKKNSDIDLLIIKDTNISTLKQAFLIRRELREPIPIDIIVRTPLQIEERIKMGDFFIKRIMQKGIVL